MVTSLDHESLFHDEDLISILDGGQPVSNDDDGLTVLATLEDLVKGLLDLMLGLGIQG